MAVIVERNKVDQNARLVAQHASFVYQEREKGETLLAEERRERCQRVVGRGVGKKEFDSFTDIGQVSGALDAQSCVAKRHVVNIMLIIAKVMDDINQNDESQILTGTKEVEVQNAALKSDNAELGAIQSKINAQVVKLQHPPHQKWWKALVGIVVGLVVGIGLAALSGGAGAALAPEATAVVEGATGAAEGAAEGASVAGEEAALAGEEAAETTGATASSSGGTTAPAAGYARTSAFFSSNLTKMGLLMGAMSAGGAIGNMYQQKDAAKDANANEVVSANLSEYQVEMQKVMNELQQAENKSQNTFQLLVSNPQQQMNMASSQFSQALSSWVSTTNSSFQG
jgi:hypothetical protein